MWRVSSLNQPQDADPGDLVRVPVDAEVAVAVNLHVVADVLRPKHVLGTVTTHVERAVGRVEGAVDLRRAVAGDVDRVGRTPLLPEQDTPVDAGRHWRHA